MRFFTLFAMCAIPLLSSAADTEYTLCQVGAEGINDVFIEPCEQHVSQAECAGDRWLHWSLTNPADNGKLAIAITAMASGQKVMVRVKGCSKGYDHATMIRLVK